MRHRILASPRPQGRAVVRRRPRSSPAPAIFLVPVEGDEHAADLGFGELGDDLAVGVGVERIGAPKAMVTSLTPDVRRLLTTSLKPRAYSCRRCRCARCATPAGPGGACKRWSRAGSPHPWRRLFHSGLRGTHQRRAEGLHMRAEVAMAFGKQQHQHCWLRGASPFRGWCAWRRRGGCSRRTACAAATP